jgi:hypothetical protein
VKNSFEYKYRIAEFDIYLREIEKMVEYRRVKFYNKVKLDWMSQENNGGSICLSVIIIYGKL